MMTKKTKMMTMMMREENLTKAATKFLLPTSARSRAIAPIRNPGYATGFGLCPTCEQRENPQAHGLIYGNRCAKWWHEEGGMKRMPLAH